MPNSVEQEGKIEDILEGLEDLENKKAKVGFPAGGDPEGERSMAETVVVAAVHEFGSANAGIPPRPFVRPAIDEDLEEWGDTFVDSIASDLEDGQPPDLEQALGLAGEKAKQSIQRKIRERSKPKLSASYVENDKLKQSRTNALVRHGWMKNSVQWEIVDP